MLGQRVIGNILGNKPKKDKYSRNMSDIKDRLLGLINEYPNDYIVLSSRYGSDFKIHGPFTYREQAVEVHNDLLNSKFITSGDWKVSIYQLNKNSLSGFM